MSSIGVTPHAIGQRADQLTVYENRAAAHSGRDPDVIGDLTFELEQVHVVAGPREVAERSDEPKRDLFDLTAMNRGQRDAPVARNEIRRFHHRRRIGENGNSGDDDAGQQRQQKTEGTGH